MTIVTLVRAELRRLTASKMGIIALVALMCVPVLYAGLYLWGNNDPYGNLKDVPVGLVVEDTGATTTNADGKTTTVNFGEEVRKELKKDQGVQWIDATAAGAAKGVTDGTFDFVLTLGKEFSTDLSSPNTGTPRQATVELTTNDTNSFLATTIAGQVAEKVRASIAVKVGKEAAMTFLDGFATIRSSLSDASNGAQQLSSGLDGALDGTNQLSTGIDSANAGAGKLASGAAQADQGANTLSSGLAQIQAQTDPLPAQAAKLNEGAQAVAGGNAQLAAKGADAAARVAQFAAQVPQARSDIQAILDKLVTDQVLTAPQTAQILAQLDPLGQSVLDANQKVQGLNGQLGQLASGSQQLADGTAQLATQTPQLASAIAQAASGAAALHSGTQQLVDGSNTLASGTAQLSTGGSSLKDGLTKLDGGGKSLATGLTAGLDKVPNQTEQQRKTTAGIIGNPARVDTSAVTKASTYGAGMAPFFISLAAWIGIYALFLIIKPLSKRALTAIQRPLRVTAAGITTPAILGAIQMLAVFLIVRFALGFAVTNPVPMLGFMVVVSISYAAIILALNIWLGSVGQFLGLVLMVLQLVTAGGTFPWQTLPAPLAFLHHILPMGYAVDGIRQLMYGGSRWIAVGDLGVLLAFLAGALAISWLGARRMTRFRTLRDLRPSLIG